MYFTAALWPCFFYIGTCTAFSVFHFLLALSVYMKKNPLYIKATDYCLLGIIVIYISFFVLTLAILIVDRENIKLSRIEKMELLIIHPLFYMGYIPIISKALFFKSGREWEAIERVEDFEILTRG